MRKILLQVITRLSHLITLAAVPYVIENPAPRHDESYLDGKLYHAETADHGSLWLTTPVRTLARTLGARFVTFAYCALGEEAQSAGGADECQAWQ